MKSIYCIITTYNNEECISKLLDSIYDQNYEATHIVIADDGSTDQTKDIINSYAIKNKNIILLPLEHGERGIARTTALNLLERYKPNYIYILDSDMILEKNLFHESMKVFSENEDLGGMVIKEIPFSNYKNLATKVKVFERNVVNNSGVILDSNSIEAARLWKYEEFLKSGGINPNQISFEETQPTIRYREKGGLILKLPNPGTKHDEKHVTFKNIFGKKNYHFKMMGKTLESESKGFLKALKRWYFFRPVMYKKENIKYYFRHPILFLLMIMMYLVLTLIAVEQIVVGKIVNE